MQLFLPVLVTVIVTCKESYYVRKTRTASRCVGNKNLEIMYPLIAI